MNSIVCFERQRRPRIFMPCLTFETGMVYLVAAAKQNRMLLEHIKAHAIYRRMNDVEKEQFDDAMIEARQLASMTELISNVLQQLSGSYNNILNNNLNDNLTTLTIFEALLAVLAVITGFFGMNIPLPMTKDPNAWIYVSVCSFILWLILGKVMRWIVKQIKKEAWRNPSLFVSRII